MPPKETYISLKWISIFGEVTGLEDFSLNFVTFLLGGREWIWKAGSCQSHWEERRPAHLPISLDPVCRRGFLPLAMTFRLYVFLLIPSCIPYFSLSFLSYFRVCVCVYLYICTQAHVSLYVWRLKINNQESTMINPSPYHLRQNISPNPGSLNLTQCLLPNQVSQTNPGSLIQLRVSHPTQGLPTHPRVWWHSYSH